MNVNIEISPSRSNVLCEIFKKLRLFTDSFVLMINNERLYIQGMDSSHIIIFDLHVSCEWFEKLETHNEENFEFGLHSSLLAKILNVKSDSQSMRIYNEENSMDKLGIDFVNGGSSDYDKFFEIPLMDIDNDLLEIPPTEYDASIIIESKNFKKIIDDFNGLEFQNIQIVCNEDDIRFKSESSQGNMELNVNNSQLYSYGVIEDNQVKNSFNLNFISKMCQFKVSKYMSVQQSDGIPIEIKYLLNPTEENGDTNKTNNENNENLDNIEKLTKHWFKFYLAPCMDDNDYI